MPLTRTSRDSPTSKTHLGKPRNDSEPFELCRQTNFHPTPSRTFQKGQACSGTFLKGRSLTLNQLTGSPLLEGQACSETFSNQECQTFNQLTGRKWENTWPREESVSVSSRSSTEQHLSHIFILLAFLANILNHFIMKLNKDDWRAIFALMGLVAQVEPAGLRRERPTPGPGKGKVVFTNVGQTVASLQYANLRIEVPITPLYTAAHKVEAYAEHAKKKFHNSGYYDYAHQAERHAAQIRVEKGRMDILHTLLTPTPLVPTRAKRFIFTLSIILIGAAFGLVTGIGIYKALEIKDLAERDNTLNALTDAAKINTRANINQKQNQARLAHIMDVALTRLEDGIGNVIEDGFLKMAADLISREITRISNILAAAMDQRVHPELFTGINMNKTWTDFYHYAKTHNLQPVIQNAGDLLQLPASMAPLFDTNVTDEIIGFQVYIHVPLHTPGDEMVLHKHIPLPMNWHGQTNLFMAPHQHNILAITRDGRFFKTMENSDFLRCRALGTLHLCDMDNIVRTVPDMTGVAPATGSGKDTATCLLALFQQKKDWAMATCTTFLGPNTEEIIQLGPHQFMAVAPDSHRGTITCRGERSPRYISVDGHAVIDLEPGCTLHTATHRVTSGDAGFTRNASAVSHAYTWHLNISEHMMDHEKRIFNDLHKNLSDIAHANGIIPLQDALARLNQIPHFTEHPSFLSGATIGTFAVFALGSFLTYKMCRNCCNEGTPYPKPSAPPQTNHPTHPLELILAERAQLAKPPNYVQY